MKKTRVILLILCLLLVVFSPFLKERLVLNLDALDTLHTLYTGGPFFSARPEWLNESRLCAAHWMAALHEEAQGRLDERDQAYRQAIACDSQYVAFMQRMHPEDLSLAQISVETQPGSAESWFWAGDLLPEKKIKYYQQGLILDPKNGRKWIVLGDLLKDNDPRAAIQAYLQGCLNGDPGYNGCHRAGYIAESLGLFDDAIYYYRLSSYSETREKADILERKLTPTP